MKKIVLLLLLSFLSSITLKSQAQCTEKIETENYSYIGCLNFEGVFEGQGEKIVTYKDQVQIFTGLFKSGEFTKGKQTINFNEGDVSRKTYEDFQRKIVSEEKYSWANGNEKITLYIARKKTKEIYTYAEEDQKGLVIEKLFKEDNSIVEIKNIDNNRVIEDVIGTKEYIDVPLIEKNNQFRINLEFPTINGDSLSVPIQFDSGATGFFIGNRLYQTLKNQCEIKDLNVKSKSGGVGSEFETKYIQIKEIKIGSYLIKNVVAIVPLRNDINDLLLGVGFLKKFKEVQWSLNANTMRFYK
jgi:hypothetical protein